MITTLHGIEVEATYSAERLRAVLHEAVSAVAMRDPDLLHASTPAGSAVLALARTARCAAGELGADPRTCLTSGPGVVVVRDLVAAVRLLDRAPSDGALAGTLGTAAEASYAALLAGLGSEE